jgi:hypothetical protein
LFAFSTLRLIGKSSSIAMSGKDEWEMMDIIGTGGYSF